MNQPIQKYKTIDEYHAQFPQEIREVLQRLRQTIKQAAPLSREEISYGMPAFKQGKVLVYYAAYKAHIGFYPTPGPIVAFKTELESYKTSKGAIQFPLSEKLPFSLIRKIVKYRLAEVEANEKPKKKIIAITEEFLIHKDISDYNNQQNGIDKIICNVLAEEICKELRHAENKLWHRHPVWFIDGNPIVGYSKQKGGLRLMFWSGAGFDEQQLNVRGEKFKDASVIYNSADQIDKKALRRWLRKSKDIQWDYKNIVKRKGKLERLNPGFATAKFGLK